MPSLIQSCRICRRHHGLILFFRLSRL
ncbi:MAG: hypothetical protein IIU29_05735 [Erysipelotrichaceae bacterium]|nr:hypothetical protein [Erysipelotrichaceae bacterium]